MINVNAAACLLRTIAQNFQPFEPSDRKALLELHRHARWLAAVTDAEHRRQDLAGQIDQQLKTAGEGVERERPLARRRAEDLLVVLGVVETELAQLLNERPRAS